MSIYKSLFAQIQAKNNKEKKKAHKKSSIKKENQIKRIRKKVAGNQTHGQGKYHKVKLYAHTNALCFSVRVVETLKKKK